LILVTFKIIKKSHRKQLKKQNVGGWNKKKLKKEKSQAIPNEPRKFGSKLN
jgi:hypothetical protein